MSKQPICIVDHDFLLSQYNYFIFSKASKQPDSLLIDFSEAHIVIPEAVIRKLSEIKEDQNRDPNKEDAENNKKDAEKILNQIRCLLEKASVSSDNIEMLVAPILKQDQRLLSLFPMIEGDLQYFEQIIQTAKKIEGLKCNPKRDNTTSIRINDIVLLTNDNELAIQANLRGVKTARHPTW